MTVLFKKDGIETGESIKNHDYYLNKYLNTTVVIIINRYGVNN